MGKPISVLDNLLFEVKLKLLGRWVISTGEVRVFPVAVLVDHDAVASFGDSSLLHLLLGGGLLVRELPVDPLLALTLFKHFLDHSVTDSSDGDLDCVQTRSIAILLCMIAGPEDQVSEPAIPELPPLEHPEQDPRIKHSALSGRPLLRVPIRLPSDLIAVRAATCLVFNSRLLLLRSSNPELHPFDG